MQEFYKGTREKEEFLRWLKSCWNIEFKRIREDCDIQGSPERTLSRCVIEDKEGRLFFLEKFEGRKFSLRHSIAEAVAYLSNHGLKEAVPYKQSSGGEFLPFYKGSCFQISLFLNSSGIKRPDYLESDRMGKSFALFLVNLSNTSKNIKLKTVSRPFSINTYIYKLFDQMKIHAPKAYQSFLPFLEFLNKGFMEKTSGLPVAFCHGDLHPLNVIWDKESIKAVVDWEFAGFKPEVYDAANLVGCAGIENPEGLVMPMVTAFIKTLKENQIISKKGWDIFPEFILAQRFAWVSEWLRKNDAEMLEMEACYLDILVKNMADLRDIWELKE